MFLHRVFSTDTRFREIAFRDGMNILVADKTIESEQGDSRNGTGKTSLVRIIRFVTGGKPYELDCKALAEHRFCLEIEDDLRNEHLIISRIPRRKDDVYLGTVLGHEQRLTRREWIVRFGEQFFNLHSEIAGFLVRKICLQLFRTFFGNPVRGFSGEADWQAGLRFGYLLGLDPIQLYKAEEAFSLGKQRKAIHRAVREGVFEFIPSNDAKLRTNLAISRTRRNEVKKKISEYRVDDLYEIHQKEADSLTEKIQLLNNEATMLELRQRELQTALVDDISSISTEALLSKLQRVYGEVGIALPDNIMKQYEDVAAFHQSVIRNRRLFLEEEMDSTKMRLQVIKSERETLDVRRSEVFQLLESSVAFETLAKAQESFARLNSEVAMLERKIEALAEINRIDELYNAKRTEARVSAQNELAEREEQVDSAISLFTKLGEEIYSDRIPTITVTVSSRTGTLKIEPNIPGDSSTGIKGVEVFLYDMVSIVSAVRLGRTPRILVHDSTLFDAIDERQVSSCLNIGAKLAEEYGFQYIVTMNSDRLQQANESGFESTPYIIEPRLTDATEDGGLFGFRFD
jgi:uncharacterized protein YydD (DUF2326 family)